MNEGPALPRSFPYAGLWLPEVVRVQEQIWVFQCNFSGSFVQFRSWVPGDDNAQRSHKEQNLYLLLKDLFFVLSAPDPLLLKAALFAETTQCQFGSSWECILWHLGTLLGITPFHHPLLKNIPWISGESDRRRLNWKTSLVNKTAIGSKIRLNIDSPSLTTGWFIPTRFKWTLATTRGSHHHLKLYKKTIIQHHIYLLTWNCTTASGRHLKFCGHRAVPGLGLI